MSETPERIWAFAPDIFDNLSVWQDAPSPAGDTIEYVRADRIEELEAKLAKAVGLLEAWINVAAHCTIEEGVCCCGDNMDTHAEPMDSGHSPVDRGAYIAKGLVEETNATLAELTGGKGMSEEIRDGGPAFPIETTATPYAPGMSLRDWFAGQALANPYTADDGDMDRVANWAYQVADAMIAERSRKTFQEMTGGKDYSEAEQ